MIKRALVLLSVCSLPLLCEGAGLVNGTLSPVNGGGSSQSSFSSVTTYYLNSNPTNYVVVTGITNPVYISWNGPYSLVTATGFTTNDYIVWKRIGGTNFVVQNDPNYIVFDKPTWDVFTSTNDTGFDAPFQNNSFLLPLGLGQWTDIDANPLPDMFVYNAYALTTTTSSVSVFVPSVASSVYYVDSSYGNDARDGTSLYTAFKTLDQAVFKASTNQSIIVSPGIYTVNNNLNVKSGMSINGYGNSSIITNTTSANFTFGDNFYISNIRYTAPQSAGGRLSNMTAANTLSIFDNVELFGGADGLSAGTVSGILWVRNGCYFHSYNDSLAVSVATNALMILDGITMRSENVLASAAFVHGLTTSSPGTVYVNGGSITISNRIVGGSTVTNCCILIGAGSHVILNGPALYYSNSTNAIPISTDVAGFVSGWYLDNGSNVVVVGNGSLTIPTNAAPSSVTIGVTAVDYWLKGKAPDGTTTFIPSWKAH